MNPLGRARDSDFVGGTNLEKLPLLGDRQPGTPNRLVGDQGSGPGKAAPPHLLPLGLILHRATDFVVDLDDGGVMGDGDHHEVQLEPLETAVILDVGGVDREDFGEVVVDCAGGLVGVGVHLDDPVVGIGGELGLGIVVDPEHFGRTCQVAGVEIILDAGLVVGPVGGAVGFGEVEGRGLGVVVTGVDTTIIDWEGRERGLAEFLRER